MNHAVTLDLMEYTSPKITSESQVLEVIVRNSVVHQKDLEEIRDAVETLAGDFYGVLCDLSEVSRIPSDIRNRAWKSDKGCVAKAIVVNSFLKELLIKSYLLMISSDYPIRIFFDKEEAKNWLIAMCAKPGLKQNIRNVVSML